MQNTSSGLSSVIAVRSIGFWMAVVLVAYVFVNVARSLINPVGFSEYYGVPLVNPTDTGFVVVYAIRSLFLGLYGSLLIGQRQYRLLAWYALVGAVMPLGDAILVTSAGAEISTITRHALTVIFMLLTAWQLFRWVNKQYQKLR